MRGVEGIRRKEAQSGMEKKGASKKLVRLAMKNFLSEEYLCGHIGCNIRCQTPKELQLHMAKDHRTVKHCRHCSAFSSVSKSMYNHSKECSLNPKVFKKNLLKKKDKAASVPHTIS